MVNSEKSRIAWVDYAKGICIILVVMMHSTLGVEKAVGHITWLHGFIEWAKPFRMPDFFMISGLFLASRITKPWRTYLDSKLVHFTYFYLLWMSIQCVFKAYPLYLEQGIHGVMADYALGFIQPYGTLWFIYLLAIFFVVTKLVQNIPPLVIFAVAAILEIAPIETGWMVIDEFASRYVYFFAGFWMAKNILSFANAVDKKSMAVILSGLVIWGFANFAMVQSGYAHLPIVSLFLGFVGAAAVVSSGVFLSKANWAKAISYCGENSIVIYLSFFLFMASSRSLMLKLIGNVDLGVISLLVTFAGVVGPILLFRGTRNTPLGFLFKRPSWARLALNEKQWHTAPHGSKLHIKTR